MTSPNRSHTDLRTGGRVPPAFAAHHHDPDAADSGHSHVVSGNADRRYLVTAPQPDRRQSVHDWDLVKPLSGHRSPPGSTGPPGRGRHVG